MAIEGTMAEGDVFLESFFKASSMNCKGLLCSERDTFFASHPLITETEHLL